MHSRTLRSLTFLAALGAAACKDDPAGPSGGTPSAVIVNSPQTVLLLGASVPLTATAYNAENAVVPGATFEWESLNTEVASVSNSGLVTGLSVGPVTIRATSGGRSGDVLLTVDPDPCVTPITLSVGQARILAGPSAVACITLAANTAPADYLFVTANATQQLDNEGQYQVAVPALAGESSLATALAFQPVDPRLLLEQRAVEYVDDVESVLRAQEHQLLQRMKPVVQAQRRAETALVEAEPAAALEGDTISYKVPDIHSSNLCTTFTTVRGVVKRLTAHATIVEDVNAPSGGFSDADYGSIAQEFENLIYRTDTIYFGRETDRNNDGRITVLYTPEVNKATSEGQLGFVAGFFWGGDLVRLSEYQQQGITCPQTNEQEIFYVLVPDPNGTINNNPRSVATVSQNTRGTIAHEFQHMINQGIRLFDPDVEAAETPWLNEALSHMAEELVGRALRGFGDFQDLAFNEVNPNPAQQDDYNAFFRQNLARFRSWMQRPDTASPISAKARDQLAPRGAGWMFLRYATDHFSGNNAKAFLRTLVAGPDVGLPNLLQHTGAQFDDLLSGFLLSQYADGLNVPGVNPRFTVRSWDVRSVMAGSNNNVFPLLVTPLPGTLTTKSLSGSGNFFRLDRDASSSETVFHMLAPGGSQVNFTGARVYLLRVQ